MNLVAGAILYVLLGNLLAVSLVVITDGERRAQGQEPLENCALAYAVMAAFWPLILLWFVFDIFLAIEVTNERT